MDLKTFWSFVTMLSTATENNVWWHPNERQPLGLRPRKCPRNLKVWITCFDTIQKIVGSKYDTTSRVHSKIFCTYLGRIFFCHLSSHIQHNLWRTDTLVAYPIVSVYIPLQQVLSKWLFRRSSNKLSPMGLRRKLLHKESSTNMKPVQQAAKSTNRH